MFKKFIDYYKDNPQGYWFKRKLYGWGWTPVKWQGWLVILLFVGWILCTILWLRNNHSPNRLLILFASVIVAVILMIVIAHVKGEKPKWQWGIPRKKDRDK